VSTERAHGHANRPTSKATNKPTNKQTNTPTHQPKHTYVKQQDRFAIVKDGEWWRLLTAGLLHSGIVPTLWCISGLRNAGAWIELGTGSALQTLVVFAACGAGATMGQLLARATSAGLAGAGLVTGVYVAWLVLGVTRARGQMPVTSELGILLLALNTGLAVYQPAVGLASLLGGAVGGAVGMLLAPVLARVVFFALALPIALALALARLGIETARLLLGVVGLLLLSTGKAAVEAVRTVRGV